MFWIPGDAGKKLECVGGIAADAEFHGRGRFELDGFHLLLAVDEPGLAAGAIRVITGRSRERDGVGNRGGIRDVTMEGPLLVGDGGGGMGVHELNGGEMAVGFGKGEEACKAILAAGEVADDGIGAERGEEGSHPVFGLAVVAEIEAAVADVADGADAVGEALAAGELIGFELELGPFFEEGLVLGLAGSLPEIERAADRPKIPVAHAGLKLFRVQRVEGFGDVIEAIDPDGFEVGVEGLGLLEKL